MRFQDNFENEVWFCIYTAAELAEGVMLTCIYKSENAEQNDEKTSTHHQNPASASYDRIYELHCNNREPLPMDPTAVSSRAPGLQQNKQLPCRCRRVGTQH